MWLKDCFLDEVVSARNPLVPGFHLSVTLASAAEKAFEEGERRKLIGLQESVNALLLEILERLPQTVRGFEENMDGCAAVFKPEGSTKNLTFRPGPLRVVLEARQQMETFCTMPLITNFLSHRFTRGLPDLWDTGDVLRDRVQLKGLTGGRHYWSDENLVLYHRWGRCSSTCERKTTNF